MFSVFSLVFKDSHHFSGTLGSLWWQSLKTAIASAELWAVFDDNLSRQPSLGNVWRQSRQPSLQQNLWAMFEDSLWRQPSLQQNFGQSLMTIVKDSHHFSRTLGSVWWQSLMTTLFSNEPFAAAFGKKQSVGGHEIVGTLLVCHLHRTRDDRVARAAEADDVAAPAQVKVPGRYLQRALQHFPEPFHAASSSPWFLLRFALDSSIAHSLMRWTRPSLGCLTNNYAENAKLALFCA